MAKQKRQRLRKESTVEKQQSNPVQRSAQGRGPLAPPEEDIQPTEIHSPSSDSEVEIVSGLGNVLHTFRNFRQTSDATALVDSLTSLNNGLLHTPEEYAEAEAETSRGIRRPATKVGGTHISAPRVKGKGKEKEREKGKEVWARCSQTYLSQY